MATIKDILMSRPEHVMCSGCDTVQNEDTHDQAECRRENDRETPEEIEERLRDIEEDRAFEAWREDTRFGR